MFLSWGLHVLRQQKPLCSLTLPGGLWAAFLSHLPPLLTSSLFCHIPSAKQIFCSLATCHTPCQAVKRIPGSSVMWCFSLGEPTGDLGLGEGGHGCSFLCLGAEGGGAWHLGHKDLGSALASSTDGLGGLGPVVCPPQASASLACVQIRAKALARTREALNRQRPLFSL